MKTEVLNIEIDCLKREGLEKELRASLTGKRLVKIGKINTEFLLRSIRLDEFAEAISKFDIKIADGSGVLWAAKYLSLPLTSVPILRQVQAIWQAIYSLLLIVFKTDYNTSPIPERFPGMQAFYLMIEAALDTKSSVYFFGSEVNVLERTIDKVREKYPDLKISGWHDGYNYDDREMVRDINRSEAKLLIVALGSPKQEYWIRDHADELNAVRIAVGEGGTFDFIAGAHQRAPRRMQEAGIEWLWRVFMNRDKTGGSRLKRVWEAVPVFIYIVVKRKINGKKNSSV